MVLYNADTYHTQKHSLEQTCISYVVMNLYNGSQDMTDWGKGLARYVW